jgi:phage gp46-like protein
MLDIALRPDASRRLDLAIEGRDLALDRTPVTTMLLAIGCERRALPDDVLPGAPAPAGFGDRRGWVGDALDAVGRRLGSRLWLLIRAKETDETRRRAERYAAEALARLREERGLVVSVQAAWARRGVLALTCRAGETEVVVPQAVAG